jgi:hypothetical protein
VTVDASFKDLNGVQVQNRFKTNKPLVGADSELFMS